MQAALDPWAAYWARRYSWALKGRPFLDLEDLQQSAALGAWIAKQTYKEECGSWKTYSSYFIQNEIRALIGIKQQRLPALTLSLDAPLAPDGDENDGTILDTIPDTSVPDTEEVILQDEVRDTVRDAVERLQDALQRQVIQIHRFDGKSISETAQALEITETDVRRLDRQARFQHLARDRRIYALITMEDLTPYYRRTGVNTFFTTRTSTTEGAALWRIEQREQIEKRHNAHEDHEHDAHDDHDRFRQAWEQDAARGEHAPYNKE